MDEIIAMREDGAPGVAINRQRRKFPFEIFNTLLTVICLASVVFVVYKLLLSKPGEKCPTPGEECMIDKGPFMLVIHAEATGSSENNILTLENGHMVKNNSIIVPCDGIYLLYVLVTVNTKSLLWQIIINRGEDLSIWAIRKAEVNIPLVITVALRSKERINVLLNKNNEAGTISQTQTYLGIALLHAEQGVKFCQESL